MDGGWLITPVMAMAVYATTGFKINQGFSFREEPPKNRLLVEGETREAESVLFQ